MIGQVAPLQIGTKIKCHLDGKEESELEYVIKDIISQGSSGIVYKATYLDENSPVILKEYYPYNNSFNSFSRNNGVIVHKDDNSPYSKNFLDKARKEKYNNWHCNSKDGSGEQNTRMCFISKILIAFSIEEPDSAENPFDDNAILGVFLEMASYSNVVSFDNLLDVMKDRLYEAQEDTEEHYVISSMLSDDKESFSAYGIITLISSILKSVNWIHIYGWVHRDLKLTNMLFEMIQNFDFSQGITILIDFGSAQKLIDGTDPLHASKGNPPYTEGTTKGYQPPEILDENIDKYHYEGWTKASDIYQIGCIAYYLFCGEYPPKSIATSSPEKLEAIISRFALNPEENDVLKCILSKALESDPLLRYKSILEFQKEIDEAGKRLSPEAEKINYRRNLIVKASTEDICENDYYNVYEIVAQIKNHLKNTEINIDGKLVESVLEFRVLEMACLASNKASAFGNSIKLGILYVESFRFLLNKHESLFFNSQIIAVLGRDYFAYSKDELGNQLIREAFRFTKDPYNILQLYDMLYSSLLRFTDIVPSKYNEAKDILEAWGKIYESNKDLNIYDNLRFYYYNYRLVLADYERDFYASQMFYKLAVDCNEHLDKESRIQNTIMLLENKCATLSLMGRNNETEKPLLECITLLEEHQAAFPFFEHLNYSYNVNIKLSQCYYLQGKFYDAAKYLIAAIIPLETIIQRITPSYQSFLPEVLSLGSKILGLYNGTDDDGYIDKLYRILARYPLLSGNKIVNHKSNPINYDIVSKSIRLAYESPYIPKRFRPLYKKDISARNIENIIKTYSNTVSSNDIISIVDSSLIRNGKCGTVFTKDGICSSYFQTKRLIKYEELKDVALTKDGNIALTFNNGQYEENAVPEAKLLVAILKGETKIRL